MIRLGDQLSYEEFRQRKRGRLIKPPQNRATSEGGSIQDGEQLRFKISCGGFSPILGSPPDLAADFGCFRDTVIQPVRFSTAKISWTIHSLVLENMEAVDYLWGA